ncbi:NADH-quinone oxidoreductase subunit NuoG [Candidatus Protochlamydia phocaeensis]|uniref:NADH-quinone oxidoreductase subunit NuoG n=1 Tax=Candidatus Protochlamydia phocaeensis TaxID=1414722 RepID=UPI000837E53F|nr:NADH-quinone oxidoreductase subunit NuoG [Candidatus Protochlamydia phocaeensis]
MQTTDQVNIVTFTLDGQSISVPKGTTVYTAAKQHGINIPVFCYQDRMPPFGACRMCLVEVEKMPKLQTSCTLVATEGMVVKTHSEAAEKGREGILEFLLINHPLDCPICDRGGECLLQDNTMAYGPGRSRFFEEKRHFVKPWSLGPVLMLDRERCIVCARCTRFGDIIAGDHALEMMERGYRSEVGTPDGGPAESKFIGNTIQLCPVGALTSDVYRFRARPWDNDSTPSTCTLCPVGCSMFLDSRDGEIMRTRSRENHEVNDIWLCDKGFFGYEFTYHPDRLQQPLIRKGDKLETASWEEAIALVSEKMKAFQPEGKIAAWGGNPLTVEENYLLQKLMRERLGSNHIDHRIGMPIMDLHQEGMAPGMEMAIGECEQLSFAILFGLDLTEEFPVIWLRLKQAINRGATVIFIGHFAPEIAPHLAKTIIHAPGRELELLREHLPNLAKLAEEGKEGAIFIGRQYLASPERASILSELDRLRQTFPSPVSLNLLEGRGNSEGARLAGMRPDLKPFGRHISEPGLNALQVLESAAREGWDLLYVVGANPALKFPSDQWKEARSKLKFLVVQDLFLTETAKQADVVLPPLCFVEKGGHFINIEGRVQKIEPGKAIPPGFYSDGEIFTLLADKMGTSLILDDHFLNRLKPGHLFHERAKYLKETSSTPAIGPREGKLAATFSHTLFDHGERMKHDPHVIRLVKEPRVRLHPFEGAKRGLQDGEMALLTANGRSITAKLRLDKRVAEGTVVLPLGFEKIPVHEFDANLLNGLLVDIQKEV